MRRLTTVLCWLGMLVPAGADAAEYRVDTTADGAGNCAVAGQCSLRAAIQAANGTNGVRDTVRVPPGTYELTLADLIVTMNDQVDVVGEDPRQTTIKEVSGGDGRVFLLEQNSAMALSNVTVTGATAGSAVLLFGGGIDFRAANVTFTGNAAIHGGAIDATGGAVTLENSTVTGNTASGQGGGIYLGGTASTLTATNSTISGNTAPAGAGVYVDAGAASLTHVTLADGLFVDTGASPGSASLRGTIVGGCAGGPPASLGSNLEPGATCALAGPGDRPAADPRLSPLRDNGGFTATHEPGAGSAALDAAAGCPPPATDQRGIGRPQGAACDIGAVEVPVTPAAAIPRLTSMRFTPATFRAASRGAALARARRRPPVGSTVRFSLDLPATVRFTLRRATSGRRVGTRCVMPTRGNRSRPRCTRLIALRGAYERSLAAGRRSVRVRGRWAGRRLAPGAYRLYAVARSGARVGAPVWAGFRIAP